MSKSITASAMLLGFFMFSNSGSANEISYYKCSDFIADAGMIGKAAGITGAGLNAVFGYAFISGGFFGATGTLPAQSNPDLEEFVEHLIAECTPKPTDSALVVGLELARKIARSRDNQGVSKSVGLPVEMKGVTVTPYNIRPTSTLGGHKTRVVFTVVNRTNSIVDIRVECSFYEHGTPADDEWTFVQSVPSGGEVVSSIPSHANATHASCRPTEVRSISGRE